MSVSEAFMTAVSPATISMFLARDDGPGAELATRELWSSAAQKSAV